MGIQLDKKVNPLELRVVGINREVKRLTLWACRIAFYLIILQVLPIAILNLIAGWYAFAAGQFVAVFVLSYVLYLLLQRWSVDPQSNSDDSETTTKTENETTKSDPQGQNVRKPASDEVKCANCATIVDHRTVDCPECGLNTRTGK